MHVIKLIFIFSVIFCSNLYAEENDEKDVRYSFYEQTGLTLPSGKTDVSLAVNRTLHGEMAQLNYNFSVNYGWTKVIETSLSLPYVIKTNKTLEILPDKKFTHEDLAKLQLSLKLNILQEQIKRPSLTLNWSSSYPLTKKDPPDMTLLINQGKWRHSLALTLSKTHNPLMVYLNTSVNYQSEYIIKTEQQDLNYDAYFSFAGEMGVGIGFNNELSQVFSFGFNYHDNLVRDDEEVKGSSAESQFLRTSLSYNIVGDNYLRPSLTLQSNKATTLELSWSTQF